MNFISSVQNIKSSVQNPLLLLLLSTIGFPRVSGLREVNCSAPALEPPPQMFCPPNFSTEHFPVLCARAGSPQGAARTFWLVTDASFTRIFSRLTFSQPPHKSKGVFLGFFPHLKRVVWTGGGCWRRLGHPLKYVLWLKMKNRIPK